MTKETITVGDLTISRTRALERIEKYIYRATTCHFWIGYTKNGYGHTTFGDHGDVYMHVLAFVLFHGPIPQGREVCHQCDIRQCINPSHLYAGTRLENVRDAWAKGLGFIPEPPRGEEHHLATLTDSEVRRLRKAMSLGTTAKMAAGEFGCSERTAFRLHHGLVRRDAGGL